MLPLVLLYFVGFGPGTLILPEQTLGIKKISFSFMDKTYIYEPHIGEAVAFIWALETARHLSFSRILFETDCASMEKQAYSEQ